MTESKKEQAMARVEPQDIFARFDELDDQAIVQELQNQIVEDWVYHFPPTKGAKEVWGLGKKGVDACSREYAKKGIALREELPVDYKVDPTSSEHVLFAVRVRKIYIDKDGSEAEVDSAIGTKRQWIKLRKRDGSVIPDPFWFEKGSQKAIRNAKSRLIDDDIKAKIIEFTKKNERVKELKPQSKTQQETKKEYPKIEITLSDGSKVKTSKFEVWKKMEKMKNEMGNQSYYKVLGDNGYEHCNQIPNDKLSEVYSELIKTYKMIGG